jgi:hypothetical protein
VNFQKLLNAFVPLRRNERFGHRGLSALRSAH